MIDTTERPAGPAGRGTRRKAAGMGLAATAFAATQLVGVSPAGATAATCTGAGGVGDLDCTTVYGGGLWVDDAEVRMWRWASYPAPPIPRQVCQYNARFFGTSAIGFAYESYGNHQNGCALSPVWVDSPTINQNFKANRYFCGEAIENSTHSGRYVCVMITP